MEYVILGLLILKSQTLYELNNAFKKGISLFYSASYGSLQTGIKNLIKKEFLDFEEQIDNGRNKKIYTISNKGKESFFTWMYDEIPVTKLEVTALSKVFFLGLIESNEDKKVIIKEIISKIQAVEEELKSMEKEISKNHVPDTFINILNYQVKTLDYGIGVHLFAKDWFVNLLNSID